MATGSEELRKLIADLGKIPIDLRRQLRPAIRKVAEPVLADARSRASYSKRIPAALRITPSFSQRTPGVSIVGSIAKAADIRVLEHGGQPGTFRHPVWGHRDRWVVQQARPFLGPAVAAVAGPALAEEIGTAIDQAARAHGFR